MALPMSEEGTFAAVEMLQSYPLILNSSVEGCHNRNRAVEICISITREMGYGATGDPVYQLSIERF